MDDQLRTHCTSCATRNVRRLCVSTEWALTRKLGIARANTVFQGHWKTTWFHRARRAKERISWP
ncbi:hypothetical protein CROQUDRAFT_673213 [Cronartium quercuum f. sp. fusiforme G11]|uniref:Uncharacterized protein n=1 Tax=Cronartium quercuum f. sp. fusiforme G11 TaxID=708437 RepID=A0A9P6NG42_9BASI|nr:hypothetical protein CROQUDRAFT_673213 [Cronartium quercuum f. sp. fusiforme G11]